MSISRKILVTAAAVAAAVAAGCGGRDGAADVASAPAVQQSPSTEQIDLHAVAGVTTAPEPITAAETAWRTQVSDYAERVDADLGRSGRLTHAVTGVAGLLQHGRAPCVEEATGNAQYDLQRALEKAAAIEAALEA